MKIVRYLLIAALAGAGVAALRYWQETTSGAATQSDATDSSSTSTSTPTITPTAASAQTATRRPDAPEPATRAHRKAARSLAEILKLPSQFEQNARLYELILSSSERELAALVDEAANLASREDRYAALQILLSRYIEIDPEAAIARARQLSGDQQQQLTTGLYLTWVRSEPDTALEYLLKQSPMVRTQVAAMLQAVDQRYGNDDYSEAFLALVANGDTDTAAMSSVRRDAAADPAAAWREALAQSNLHKRQQTLQQVLQIWARSDPQAALNAVETLPGHQRNRMQMVAVNRWLQQDADAALEWISAQPPGMRRSQMQELALSQVARMDMDKALAIANTLPAAQRSRIIDRTLGRLARENPERALAELNSAGVDLASSNTYAQILAHGELYSFAESLSRASALAPEQRQQVERQVFRRWAEQDPEEAATYLENISNPQARMTAANQLIRRWATADPTAAASWIRTAPAAERDQLQHQLVSRISQVDPDAALNYLKDIEAPQQRDQAAISILPQLLFDLQAADALVQDMRTETGKQQARSYMYQLLKQTNSPDAQRYQPATDAAERSGSGVQIIRSISE